MDEPRGRDGGAGGQRSEPDSGEQIPVAPSSRSEPQARLDKPSLLGDAGEDACPRCGASMAPEALVCVRCGYDLAANQQRKTKVGAVVEENDAPGPGVFCEPGPVGWRIPLGVGAAAIVAAALLAGFDAHAAREVARAEGETYGGRHWLFETLRVLVYGPLYAGLGVAAVAVTARVLEERMGRVEYAMGRMTLAVGLFALALYAALATAMPHWAGFIVGAGVGAGLYFLTVWWMFRTTAAVVMTLGGVHFVMWVLLYVVRALD